MPNISSDTLFHFTNFENLKGILKYGFYPRYSIETQEFEGKAPYVSAWPMVCFCDIPLSQVKKHLKTYDEYGIGMSREWVISMKLNPVMYIRTGSDLSQWLYRMIENIAKLSAAEDPIAREIKGGLLFMLKHIKPFEGINKKGDRLKFYNEREWRYIPHIVHKDDGKQDLVRTLQKREEYNNPECLEKNNELTAKYKLGFRPQDIQYIIVKNEEEILDMVDYLGDVKSDYYHYDEDTVKILTTRIITSAQIKKDF